MEKILVVDDDLGIGHVCERVLAKEGYDVTLAANGEEAMDKFVNAPFDAALFDLRMPGTVDGMELLARTKKSFPQTEVIIITAETTIEVAIECLKLGAFDYIVKPFNLSELLVCVKKALEYAHLKRKENIFRETTYLYQLANEIDRTHSKEDLLKFILERAAAALNADSGSIFLVIPEINKIRRMSFFGYEWKENVELEMGDSIAGWVAKNNKPLMIHDKFDNFPQFKDRPVRQEIASSMIIPMIRHDTLLGVICLNRLVNLTNIQFTPRDLEALQIFATHAALILSLHFDNILE